MKSSLVKLSLRMSEAKRELNIGIVKKIQEAVETGMYLTEVSFP
jgi:hypothetical protein